MLVPIVVTALVGEIGAVVAKEVAKKLDQDFLNLEKSIQYQLSSIVLKKYNQQDIQELEQKQICLAFQNNSVIFVPYDMFVHNQDLFAGKKVFYVFVPQSTLPQFDVVGQIAYQDRNTLLEQKAEKIDSFNFDIEKIVNQIIKKLGKNNEDNSKIV